MSLFDKYKSHTQYSQNTQNSKNDREKNNFADIADLADTNKKQTIKEGNKVILTHQEDIATPIPTYKRVGRYESEEHLRQELKKYPRIVPCPKDDWHWQDKERCYQVCKRGVPKECIYHRVAYYRIRT